MSTGAIIAVIVAVVVVIAVVAVATVMRGAGTGGSGLKRRFGPEYERTLARHDGDDKATRQELAERGKRYGDVANRPVSAQQRERYGARWAEAQAHFVDEPGRALREADQLIAEVATGIGYPAADSPEHFDAVSVHHAHQVEGYRRAHALAEHADAGGHKGTEDMRQALITARALFDDMLRDAGGSSSSGTASGTASGASSGASSDTAEREPAAPADSALPPQRSTIPDSTPDATAPDAAARTADPVPAAGEPTTETAAERSRDEADRDKTGRDGADPDAVEGGQEHHRPLADRFAALTGTRRGHSDDDHS